MMSVRSYLLGFGIGLRERVSREKAELKKKESSGRYELVVFEKSKHVDNWVDSNLKIEKGRHPTLNHDAFDGGKSHAEMVDLLNKEKLN